MFLKDVKIVIYIIIDCEWFKYIAVFFRLNYSSAQSENIYFNISRVQIC